MWKVWMVALLVAVCASLSQAQGTSGKSDEVFLDMGDGDFGDMPQVPARPEASAPGKKPEMKSESNATLEIKDVPAEAPVESLPPKGAPEWPRSKFGKKSGAPQKDPGLFVTTKVPCPMRREPASESEQISTTKAPRKIWVQKVDDNWVKAYTKTGEAGYLNMECFEK